MMIGIILLAIIGFSLSLYAYLVEQKKEQDPEYQPACDINDSISCSKAFQSPYGKFLSVSTAVWGMLFYAALIGPALFNLKALVLIMAVGANIISAILAYNLYMKVKAYCIICTSIYLVNILLLILSLRAIF